MVVAAACLAGLSKEASTYVLPPVDCTKLGAFIKKQKVPFPGKLVQYLKREACSGYFQVVGKPPFQVLANLPALITSQSRSVDVQAILSHLTTTEGLCSSRAITVPQQNSVQPVRPGVSIGGTGRSSSRNSSQAKPVSSSSLPSKEVRTFMRMCAAATSRVSANQCHVRERPAASTSSDSCSSLPSLSVDYLCGCLQVPVVLCTLASVVSKVWNKSLKGKQIAIDCEGCSLSRTGRLTLVQVMHWHYSPSCAIGSFKACE